MSRRSLAFFFLLLSLLAGSASASVVVFGPKTYPVAAHKHQQYDEQVPLASPCDTARAVYTLSVTNAGAKSGTVSLNGAVVVSDQELRKASGPIEKTVAVAASNALRVELDGDDADGAVSISIRRHIDLTQTLGEKTYSLAASKSDRFEETFSVADTTGPFTLILRNGNASLLPVDDARVVLNGTQIITKADIDSRGNQNDFQTIARDVRLLAQNTVQIELKANKVPAGVTLTLVRHLSDAQGPAIALTGVQDGQTVTSSPLTLAGTVTDDSGVSSFSVNGASVPLGAAGAFTTSVALKSGPNAIVLAAADCEGNARQQQITITLGGDTTPPAVSIDFPPAGTNFFRQGSEANPQTSVSGAVSDAQSGVATVTCNGRPASVADGTYDCSVSLVPGVNHIVVEAVDAAGNRGRVADDVPLIVDDVPPTISTNLPSPNANGWRSSPPFINFDCRDDVEVISCPATEYPKDGANQHLSGTAMDGAGNRASLSIDLNFDATRPALVLDGPPEVLTNAATVRITGTVSDATSGVATVVCGSTAATRSGDRFECVVPIVNGLQTIEIVATDLADNQRSERIAVTRDAVPPQLAIEEPAAASFTTTEPTIAVAGTASDDDAVASLTVGGQAVAPDGNRFAAEIALAEGSNHIEVRAADPAGNVSTRTIDVVYQRRAKIAISSPADLAVLRGPTVTVTGTISGPAATVQVNGVAATVSGSTFTLADVPLWQGRTVITAAATTATGQTSSASINVYRDGIPPRVVVYSPAADSEVSASPVIVSGMVDDIVVGTINAGQVQVTVNGVPAVVSNRTFEAANVALTPGANTLIVTAKDQGGNTTTVAHNVRFVPSTAARLVVAAGNDQTTVIGTELPLPLRVRALDSAGNPVAGKALTFTIAANNGTLAGAAGSGRSVTVTSDAQGEATVRWTLGTRAGVANQQVTASATGFASAGFVASGTTGAPALIVVDMGNNQFGVDRERLPRPLVVAVVDRGSNRVANVPVTFSVLSGGGSFDGAPSAIVRTDSDGRAWITPALGPEPGPDSNRFSASVAGVATPAVFNATSAPAGPPAATRISGVVLDNTSIPIAGVTLRIEGTPLQTQTGAQGQFTLASVPVGYVRLIADGSTAQRPGTWPTLEFAMYTNAGQDNTVGMPIFLLPIDNTRGVQVDEQRGGTITLPELPGFSLTIAPGAATFPSGLRTGTISATLVHSDKMPMVPGFGQQPRFLVTIQPPGVHFDPPAALAMPNVDGLAPGEVTEMYSFDHDLGQFVAIGTGSVSADGSVVRSDPGVGIIKSGWHCGGNPAGTGAAATVGVDLKADEFPAAPAAPAKVRKTSTRTALRRAAPSAASGAPDFTTFIDSSTLLTADGFPTGGAAPVGTGSYIWSVDSGSGTYVSSPPCINQSKCPAELTSSAVGEVTARVTYNASGPSSGSDFKTAKVAFVDPTITIDALTFDQGNNIPIGKDGPGMNPYNNLIKPLVWKKGGVSEPVAYVRKKKMEFTATFRISSPLTTPIEHVTIQGDVAADPKRGLKAMKFIKEDFTIPAGKDTFDVLFKDGSGNATVPALPDTTFHFHPMNIVWTLRKPSMKTPRPAGTSDLKVYVTYFPPDSTPVILTLLDLAVGGDAVAGTMDEVINNTFAKFIARTIKSWDGRPFTYYPTGSRFRQNYDSVRGAKEPIVEFLSLPLNDKDFLPGAGRCGIMAELLYNSLLVNNLLANRLGVYPTLPKNCDRTRQFCASGMLIGVPDVTGWKYVGKTLKPPLTGGEYYYAWKNPPCGDNDNLEPCDYEMVGSRGTVSNFGDLVAIAGPKGQNNMSPSQKAFPNHEVVAVYNGTKVRFLDSSYGIEYQGTNLIEAAADFQMRSIAGYLIAFEGYDIKAAMRPHPAPGSPFTSSVTFR